MGSNRRYAAHSYICGMKKLFSCLFLLCLSSIAIAQTLRGRAVGISDGDTFTLLQSDKSTLRVRLYGIDCPEKGQDFGNKAKEFTKDFLKDKNVIVQQKDIDRYGRIVGIAHVTGTAMSLNEALLKAGLAWHYTYYDHNPEWTALEQNARLARKGLWQMKSAVAPWQFRKAERLLQP